MEEYAGSVGTKTNKGDFDYDGAGPGKGNNWRQTFYEVWIIINI
jgi:hypothetical protein